MSTLFNKLIGNIRSLQIRYPQQWCLPTLINQQCMEGGRFRSLWGDSETRIYMQDERDTWGSYPLRVGSMKQSYGQIHSDEGPALQTDTLALYVVRNFPHAEGHPALLYDELDNFVEGWFYRGFLHREGGPALTIDCEGSIESFNAKVWAEQGKTYRVEFSRKPSVIGLDPNRALRAEIETVWTPEQTQTSSHMLGLNQTVYLTIQERMIRIESGLDTQVLTLGEDAKWRSDRLSLETLNHFRRKYCYVDHQQYYWYEMEGEYDWALAPLSPQIPKGAESLFETAKAAGLDPEPTTHVRLEADDKEIAVWGPNWTIRYGSDLWKRTTHMEIDGFSICDDGKGKPSLEQVARNGSEVEIRQILRSI